MNSITLHGNIIRDASVNLININGSEIPKVSFSFIDFGLPYQKNEPMCIDVEFIKEAAMHIYEYLKKGKEVVVTGCLRCKIYTTQQGLEKQKYYIQADYIVITGIPEKTK